MARMLLSGFHNITHSVRSGQVATHRTIEKESHSHLWAIFRAGTSMFVDSVCGGNTGETQLNIGTNELHIIN